MSSYLLALWVNRDSGEPSLGRGRIGHVVRVGANPAMPNVQEFTDGGRFAHEDCAPASILSRLIEGGIHTNASEIEVLAGTGLNGTGFPGCIAALQHFGIDATFSRGACPSGWIMNPMIPTNVPRSEFSRYLAASQGGCIVMADPVAKPPIPQPKPTPHPSLEEDVPYLFNAGAAGIWCLYWGKYFHVTPDDIAAFEAIAAKPIQTIGAAGHAVLLATYGA